MARQADNQTLCRAEILCQIANIGAQFSRFGARCFRIIPRDHAIARRAQCRHGCEARTAQPEMAVSPEYVGNAIINYLSFNVARPTSARTTEIIQNRMTMVLSAQPRCSKW